MENTYNHENDTIITSSDARRKGRQARLRASAEGSASMFRTFSFWPITAPKPTEVAEEPQDPKSPSGKSPVRRVSYIRKIS